MENMGRPEKGRRKLFFCLSVKHGEINGSRKGTVSLVQGMGYFLEEMELELGLPVVGLGIWEILGNNGLVKTRSNQFLMVSLRDL